MILDLQAKKALITEFQGLEEEDIMDEDELESKLPSLSVNNPVSDEIEVLLNQPPDLHYEENH